ncbi:lycopene cyclase domain-containing protein [Actinocatenispora sera]|uniref:Lycopene cyclase n=1 Tax=Actinocatenispora sera TaxID=390989 RepID=A0A810KZV1_9ACTN|nr:lycopene cyclase domain-containing protein [Actinocatenispora sera]BCJ28664.1 lycopene cyclase [Actinocatenispora sera]
MIGEYTIGAIVAPLVALGLSVLLRTGLLGQGRFWLTVAITMAFQIPVDGALTRLSDPIVSYRPGATCGIRFPWDIPIEDFGFGFALVVCTLSIWVRLRRRSPTDTADTKREVTTAGAHR